MRKINNLETSKIVGGEGEPSPVREWVDKYGEVVKGAASELRDAIDSSLGPDSDTSASKAIGDCADSITNSVSEKTKKAKEFSDDVAGSFDENFGG